MPVLALGLRAQTPKNDALLYFAAVGAAGGTERSDRGPGLRVVVAERLINRAPDAIRGISFAGRANGWGCA